MILTTTIARGAALSAVVPLGGCPVLALAMPAAWDEAPLTVQVSPDGQTFYDLDGPDDTALTLAAEPGRVIWIDDYAQWAGIRFLKLRSGTPDSPLAQSGDRSILIGTGDQRMDYVVTIAFNTTNRRLSIGDTVSADELGDRVEGLQAAGYLAPAETEDPIERLRTQLPVVFDPPAGPGEGGGSDGPGDPGEPDGPGEPE